MAARRALPTDYDDNPRRFRLARDVARRHGLASDVHADVARRVLAADLVPLLDVGCGHGELARHLPADGWVGIDNSKTMLESAPHGAVVGHAQTLPFADESFGSVALLYVLYHLPKPARALEEARRVLRPGGLIAVAAPSRDDSPELASMLPSEQLTFDAELAPELLADHFQSVEVRAWDAPLLLLPSRDAVRDYLIGKGTSPRVAARAAEDVRVPVRVTKRGALAFARKP
jgi:SAM-dependent methyltransferase